MKKPYHHGNLREVLITTACELIAEKSPQGFTLVEAAKLAGVSTAAPYRHFKNKDEVTIAVAIKGFERFRAELAAARISSDEPFASLLAMGHSYLDFSQNHQGEYMAMFESGISIEDNSELANVADAAFEELHLAAEKILEDIPSDARPSTHAVAQHIWATSHGVAELFARRSPDRATDQEAKEILEGAVRIYLHGLVQGEVDLSLSGPKNEKRTRISS